jgi:hypothetical protein
MTAVPHAVRVSGARSVRDLVVWRLLGDDEARAWLASLGGGAVAA